MYTPGLKTVVLICLIGWLGACQSSAKPVEPLEGLWVWQAEHRTKARRVWLSHQEGAWRASVNDQSATVQADRDGIVIDAPGQERFDGQWDAELGAYVGWWRQPSSTLAYSTMVTRVRLLPLGEDEWGAQFNVQDRPFRVYLDVFTDDERVQVAVIRNPERNEIMRSMRFRVEPAGDQRWRLVAGAGERAQQHALRRVEGGVQLNHAWFDEPLIMQRATPTDRIGYVADPTGSRHYTPPPPLDDGWPVADAEALGMDRAMLDRMLNTLAASDPRSTRPVLLHSVLASHRGALFLEEYFYGYDRDTPHDTRSLGKVFAPVLVGALRQRGVDIDANERPVVDVLTAAGESIDDGRKADITLGQLMSFTSGLDCDVNNPDSPGNEDNLWSQQAEPDYWRYAARLPVVHAPGTRYAYCSASINLAGASIRAAAGQPVVDVFDALIATPLGFGDYHWNLMPNGEAYLGGGSYMRPRDLLKVGAAYAAGGRWQGRAVIDAEWVTESTRAVMPITAGTTGMTQDVFESSYFGGEAAYEWRRDTVQTTSGRYASYEASGNGGQVLIVVPELELVVLFTGGNYRQGGIWGRWRNALIGGYLIPALPDASNPSR